MATIEKAKSDYEQRLEPVTKLMETLFSPDEKLEEVGELVPESTFYRSLCYKTQDLGVVQEEWSLKFVMRLYILSVGIIYQQRNFAHKHVDPAGGALEELQRIIGIIRAEWKETQIIVRGDSAYAREDIMKFCEEQACVDVLIM